MFSKTLIALTVALAATANPTTTVTVTSENPVPTTISQCNTGDAYCCNTVGQANALGGLVSSLLSLLGIVLEDPAAVVGITCLPITIGGIGGTNCAQQPVCCEYNNWNGIVNIGCDPISLS